MLLSFAVAAGTSALLVTALLVTVWIFVNVGNFEDNLMRGLADYKVSANNL